MSDIEDYFSDFSQREAPAEEELSGPAPLLVMTPTGELDLDATIEQMLAAHPGPELHSAARMLADLPEQLPSPVHRVDLMVVLERCDAALSGTKQPVLAALHRDGGAPHLTPGRCEDIRLELALGLRWSEFMAHERMTIAHEIDERLPRTSRALAEGRINFLQAREIAQATAIIGADDDPTDAAAATRSAGTIEAVEARLLPRVEDETRAETRRLARRAVMIADPAAAERRRRTARRDRCATRYADDDGQATLSLRGPAEDIATMWNAATAGADRLLAASDVETLDQGRFDTALAWATDYLRRLHLPDTGTRSTWVKVTVASSTLAGLDDLPATLEGYGPITAQTARDLAAGVPARPGPFHGPPERPFTFTDGTPIPDPPDDPDPPEGPDLPARPDPPSKPSLRWTVLPVDERTGWLVPQPGLRVDYGRSRRFATPAQAAYIRDRDLTCSMPICAMPASRGEIDHWPGWDKGSPTDVGSMGAGCTHHNRTTFNRAGWRVESHGDGSATLITPQGRSYPIQPHDYRD